MKKFLTVILSLVLTAACFAGCGGGGGGEKPSGEYKAFPILNAGFEEPLGTVADKGWDYALDNAFMIEDMSIDSTVFSEGASSLKLAPPLGGYISVYQVLPLDGEEFHAKFDGQLADQKALLAANGGALPKRGDKVEMSMDVYISGANVTDFSGINLMLESENAKKNKSILAQNQIKNLTMNAWNTVSVSAVANDGMIKDDSVLILVSIKIDVPEDSIVYIDNIRAGTRQNGGAGEVPTPPQDYENFESRGMYQEIPNASFETDDVKFKISGVSAPKADMGYFGSKSVKIASGKEALYNTSISGSGIITETLAAGVWVYMDSASTGKAQLVLRAKIGNSYTDVSVAETDKKGQWVYLKTPLIDEKTAKENSITDVRIALKNTASLDVNYDFVQLGDWQRFNGNPQKMALMAYQPWFQNNGTADWGNWKYDARAGAAFGGRLYDPAVIKSGTQQRDVASVYYPTIGVYDSTDSEVLSYHVDLIKKMGCDVIQVNYYADLPNAAYQLKVLDNLFQICAQKDMKVSILYEPKIHLSWIPHPNRPAAVQAMADDISNFIKKYDGHKALLRYNGTPMIEVFGLNLVSGSEWGTIKQSVKTSTGYDIPLMGDGIGSNDYTHIMSMFQWTLYKNDMKNFTAAQAQSYCVDLNNRVSEWADASVGARLPVGIVYPGFDDTPVMSWAPEKGIIRKINITGEEFYDASWAGFNSVKQNFDWVLVATFNDWTEGTIIEPTTQLGHKLALATMNNVAAFKGITAPAADSLDKITQAYLTGRLHDYNDLSFHFTQN